MAFESVAQLMTSVMKAMTAGDARELVVVYLELSEDIEVRGEVYQEVFRRTGSDGATVTWLETAFPYFDRVHKAYFESRRKHEMAHEFGRLAAIGGAAFIDKCMSMIGRELRKK